VVQFLIVLSEVHVKDWYIDNEEKTELFLDVPACIYIFS